MIFTLLWLPFGKLFHIFMRPAHLAVGVYKDAGRAGEQAHCRRCRAVFASRMHVEDLIAVERQLGYRYEIAAAPAEHYQWICPACRRALRVSGARSFMGWRAGSVSDRSSPTEFSGR